MIIFIIIKAFSHLIEVLEGVITVEAVHKLSSLHETLIIVPISEEAYPLMFLSRISPTYSISFGWQELLLPG